MWERSFKVSGCASNVADFGIEHALYSTCRILTLCHNRADGSRIASDFPEGTRPVSGRQYKNRLIAMHPITSTDIHPQVQLTDSLIYITFCCTLRLGPRFRLRSDVAKMYPISHRGLGMASFAFNALGSSVLALAFPYLLQAFTMLGAFGIYAWSNVPAFGMIFLSCPKYQCCSTGAKGYKRWIQGGC